MTTALLIIDVQNDFTEGGALGVNGGAAASRAITELIRDRADEYDLIAASRDWHDADNDNGGHFALDGAPDFVDSWPPHCVAGTPGAEYHPELDVEPIEVHIRKGQGKPSYSAFEGQDASGRPLVDALRDAGVDRVDVVGIATDYCVRASALDAKAAGFDVRVLADRTAPVSPERAEAVLAELRDAGIAVEGRPLTTSSPASDAGTDTDAGAGSSTDATS